ncbi:MAG: ATP-binding protein [Acetobacteraceae bacterium]|jgi:signal transduction histidine kinase/CheY-like chemotaxis protein
MSQPKQQPGADPGNPRSGTACRTLRQTDVRQDPIAAPAGDGEELLALVQEAGGLGIFEWQVPTGTVRLSPKLQTLYGLNEFDGRHESWLRCVFREDVMRMTNTIMEAFAAGATEFVDEFRIARPGEDAPRWMEAHSIVFYDNEQRPTRLVSVSVDVTERKRAHVQLHAFTEALEERVKARTRELEAENEARIRAEESLRQAQKMEVVGQLTGGLAHDFNNLLTIVMGGLDIIEHQIPRLPPSPAAQRIARARELALEGVDRAAKLTQRLLAFARQQPLTPQPIEVDILIGEISDLLRRTVGETIALQTTTTSGLWSTLADPNQLENVLLNLAINARDAMPGGGRLTIETGNCYLDDAYVAALAEPTKPGEYVVIAVSDTGFGMDAATIEHAFEPFFTTKEIGKGTGLGLSQVYGFVRQSSGHVRIDSEPGRGATVKIFLPRCLAGNKTAAVAQNATPGRANGTERILVVEDDDALRAHTTEALSDLGYQVFEARQPAAALRILVEQRQIDLLFTDIVMPGGMNGRELADAALQRWPDLKVLFTTGYSRAAILDPHQADPNIQLLRKPFSINTLAVRVRGILDGTGDGA